MKKLILFAALIITASATSGQQVAKSHDHGFCHGITKKGEPCKSVILVAGTDFCRVHNPAAVRCAFVRGNGTPCKMVVKKPGDLCRFHQKQFSQKF